MNGMKTLRINERRQTISLYSVPHKDPIRKPLSENQEEGSKTTNHARSLSSDYHAPELFNFYCLIHTAVPIV